MKTIRQTLILLTFALFFAANVTAAPLDERQRTVETVVADALAQLPAATAGDYDKIMGELAATGAEGVGILADMLVPASQGENAAVEYALNGVASFVTAAGREQLRPAVCGRQCRRTGRLHRRPLSGRPRPARADLHSRQRSDPVVARTPQRP